MKRLVPAVLLCMLFSPALMAAHTGASPENSQSCTEIADNSRTSQNEGGFRCTGHRYDSTLLYTSSQIEQVIDTWLPSWGSSSPWTFLDDLKFLLQPELETINAHHAYARRLSGQGVTIAIEDSGVDITNIDFSGRIQHAGASLVYWRPLAFLEERDSFSECANPLGKTCRVFEINAGGDSAVIQDFARRIIENLGHPSNNNTWFIHDTSQSDLFAWYEFPALYDQREGEGLHGTTVASVAAGWNFGVAPGARIVPLSINFDEQDEIQIVQQFILDDPTFLGLSRGELDRILADSVRDSYANYDIINRSYGTSSTDTDLHFQLVIDNFSAWRDFKLSFPRLTRALVQLDVLESQKTIEVWSTGNEGQPIPGVEATFPYHEPDVRGHVIAVTALGVDGRLAFYANECGPLPADWNRAEHGRHYCLAAPGTVNAIAPGALTEGFSQDAVNISGTSFAAPMVSGALALVMERFRRQLTPVEVVLRVLNTANNRGEYGTTLISTSDTGEETVWYPYGAGLLDLRAATEPVGSPRVGTASIKAPVAHTGLQTPSAWGDVGRHLDGVEVAGFDDWNAPFWYDARGLVSPLDTYHAPPLPQFEQVLETSALLPYLTWHNVGPDRRDTTAGGMKLRMAATYATADPENQWGGIIYPSFGFSAEFQPGIRVGFLMETESHHGSRSSGAFGRKVSSQLVWLARERVWNLDTDAHWQLEVAGLLAGGRPDYTDGAMFHAGGALYSAGHLRLRHRHRTEHTRTTLTLGQPLRAESGTGRLHYPTGRNPDGEWQFAQRNFSLAPASREVRLQLRHDRPLAGGRAAIEITYSQNAGHVAGQSHTHLGLGYHLQW